MTYAMIARVSRERSSSRCSQNDMTLSSSGVAAVVVSMTRLYHESPRGAGRARAPPRRFYPEPDPSPGEGPEAPSAVDVAARAVASGSGAGAADAGPAGAGTPTS